MTVFSYEAPRLGLIDEHSSTPKRLKTDITDDNADRACILITNGNSSRITNFYAVRALADELARELEQPQNVSGAKQPRGRRKRLARAKNAVIARNRGLKMRDMEMVVEIARVFYPGTPFYEGRRVDYKPERTLSVAIDESISEKLVERFSSDVTRSFHVNAIGLHSSPDKALFFAEGINIIVAKDRDFIDIASSVYIEAVRQNNSSSVGVEHLPFIVCMEPGASSKKRKASYENYSEEEALHSFKGSRRAMRQKGPRQAFNKHKLEVAQIKAFNAQLREIIRMAEDRFRPIMGISISATGTLSYHSKHDIFDRNFYPEREAENKKRKNGDVIFDATGKKKIGEIVTVDGRNYFFKPDIRGKDISAVFAKARLNGTERRKLIDPAATAPQQKRRYGHKGRGINRQHRLRQNTRR